MMCCNHCAVLYLHSSGEVLEEVLTVVSRLGAPLQLTVGALVVKVACYSWMEHILQKNIKFR